jgi:hypothetical protein
MYQLCRNLKCGCTHAHTHKYACILFKRRPQFPRRYSVGCVGGRAGLLRPLCFAGNLGNIWYACGQHELQCTEYSCVHEFDWAYVCTSHTISALLRFSETHCYEQRITSSINCGLTRICFINLDGQFCLTTLKQLIKFTVECNWSITILCDSNDLLM